MRPPDSSTRGSPLDAVLPPEVGVEGARVLASVEAGLFGRPRGTVRLRRYLLLEELASGANGVVYEAHDPELDRKVAIKIVRGSDDGGERTARLLREAQAIARLAHPNIVAIHDVGTFGPEDLGIGDVAGEQAGRPRVFIVMELVPGQTLGQWLRGASPTPREILGVFADAARGLQAAHEIGLVHRDFKPENVLVGDDGRVRILDFGLARAEGDEPVEAGRALQAALGGRGKLASSVTATGTVLGTPAYMSPEQHAGKPLDSRSDQFSFCVALHEALYGDRPFSGESVEELAAAVESGRIREPTPTSRVPKHVARALRRGLSVDPDARHPSMGVLVAELSRDPSAVWRRRAVTLGAVGALTLGALGLHYWQETRAALCSGGDEKVAGVWNEERKAALERAFENAGVAEPGRDAARVEEILDRYLAGWAAMHVDACEATHMRGEQSTELLDLRIQCLDRRLDHVGSLVQVLGDASREVVQKSVTAAYGLPAVAACADAVALGQVVSPPADPEQAAVITEVRRMLSDASALRNAGKNREARPLVEEARKRADALAYAPLQAEVYLLLARMQDSAEELQAALASATHGALRAEVGRDDHLRLEAYNQMVYVAGYRLKQVEEAEAVARQAEFLIQRIDAAPLERASLHVSLGAVYMAAWRWEDAEELFREALDLRLEALGPAHPEVGVAYNNLANALVPQEKLDEAVQAARRAVEVWEEGLGNYHPHLAVGLATLGDALSKIDRYDEAVALQHRAVEVIEHAWGKEHPRMAAAQINLGVALRRAGRWSEALTAFRDGERLAAETGGYVLAIASANAGDCLRELGRPARALEAYDRSLQTPDPAADEPMALAMALGGKGRALLELDRFEEAVEVLERGLEVGGSDAELAMIRFALGQAIWRAGGDRRRAHDLVGQAREHHVGLGAAAEVVEDIDAWLRDHPL